MIYLDLRTTSKPQFLEMTSRESQHAFVATAWQVAAMDVPLLQRVAPRTLVVVPDFLNYARLLSTGQAKQMLELAGTLPRAAMSGIGAVPAVLRRLDLTVKQDFWVVAEALLRYDLALLPRVKYKGLLLHSYLVDFASALGKGEFLSRFATAASARGRFGVTTQQLPAALTTVAKANARINTCVYLHSPNDAAAANLIRHAGTSSALAGCEFVGDLSSLPGPIQHATASAHAESSWIVSHDFASL